MSLGSANKDGITSGPNSRPSPGRRWRTLVLVVGTAVWLSLLVLSLSLYGQMRDLRAEVETHVGWLLEAERQRLDVTGATKMALQTSLGPGELESSQDLLADCRLVAQMPHKETTARETREAACGALEIWLEQLSLVKSQPETADPTALSLAEIRVTETLSALVAQVRRRTAEISGRLGKVWTTVTALGVFLVASTGLLGVFLLAERRRTELLRKTNEAIEESEKRFRTMADGAPVMIWMSGPDGRGSFFNRPWLDFAGSTLQEAQEEGWQGGVHPDDLERCLGAQRTALNTGSDLRLEYRRKRFDGEHRWMLESANPRWSGQDFVGYVGSSVDITALKRAQATLEKSKLELESRVKHRTAELEAANRMLGQEISERKQLEKEVLEIDRREQERIGGDLHDGLAQQLVGASLFLKSLENKLAQREIPEAETAGKIGRLVSEAIAQARALARGLAPAGSTTRGLRDALEELATDAKVLFGIPCRVRVSGDLTLGSDTTNLLFRIAQEAVHNAAKHAEASRIDIEVEGEDEALTIRVADDGIGIPDTATDGKGIGLRLMRYRASLVDASLSIRQGVDGGTTVLCRLSRASDGESAAKAGELRAARDFEPSR